MSATSVTPTANIDGRLSPLAEACVPVLDRGFLYGDSVYEVFRTYEGVPLFWREHLDRLENSARMIHMSINQSREKLMAEIRRAVAEARKDIADPANDPAAGEVYVRFHISRGVGPINLYPDPQLKTSFMIMVKPVPDWKPEHYTQGLRLAVTKVRRNGCDALSPNIKGGNYLNNILSMAEAVELGADDSLMLNAEGAVTESSTSNIFFVIDGKMKTPADAAGNLRGITGNALRRAGEANGWPIEEAILTVEEIATATEAFVTSATREVMPVAAIRLPSGDWNELPDGGGEQTRRAAEAYTACVNDYILQNADARLW